MFVSRSMTRKVITVDQEASIFDAQELMSDNSIRHLPILDHNRQLIGIVTDRDLKRASASDASTLEVHELLYLLSKIKIKDIMTKEPITVPFDYTIEETAQVLLENKISGVPVLDLDGSRLVF